MSLYPLCHLTSFLVQYAHSYIQGTRHIKPSLNDLLPKQTSRNGLCTGVSSDALLQLNMWRNGLYHGGCQG